MTVRSRAKSRLVAVLAVSVMLACGCGGAVVTDKAGSGRVVLRFATIDDLDPNRQTPAPKVFVEALGALSGGQVTASVQDKFEDGSPTAESDVVHALKAGTMDGGWPATRAFARAGLTGLQPLEAPFVITSHAAEAEIATGQTGRDLLATLEGSGVVALGLTEGPLRRPWSNTAPMLSPADWAGLTIRAYNSSVQEATEKALGAVPVAASYNFPDLVRSGQMQAVETDVAQYQVNGYGLLLPHVARNVVLWPKMEVLTLSSAAWSRLSSTQQEWVRQAAASAVRASVEFGYDETTPAVALCALGVRFVDATPADLAALRAEVRPVLDRLSRDPVNGRLLAEVEQVAARHPTPDLPDVAQSCRTA